MKVCIVGATGLVGQKILEVLEERNFPIDQIIPVASQKSVGKMISFRDEEYAVLSWEKAIEEMPDVAIFSAGGGTSLKLAPKFAKAGIRVIDNSSAWRMHPDHKLIVPEINGSSLEEDDLIIANPNCSTIQLVMVLKPLHDLFNIKRVVVSTYQSVSGSGVKALDQLEGEREQKNVERTYPHQIDLNILPHIDDFLDNGYTKEEMKMVKETNKILDDQRIKVTATAVRVPVIGGHSESVNIEFEKEFELKAVLDALASFPGVSLQDDVSNNVYPMPLDAHNKDDVFVGRIRRDESQENTLNCWIVSDNLRKGAATNAVQIAELFVPKAV